MTAENYIPMARVIDDTSMGEQMKAMLVLNFPEEFAKADLFTGEDSAPVISDRVNEDRKYVVWGQGNSLPLEIVRRGYYSPYVAPSMHHLTNNTVSAGIRAYYVYYTYQNGVMKREMIDYEAAGLYLRSRIRELKQEQAAPVQRATMQPGQTAQPASAPVDNSEEIKQLEGDLAKWDATMKAWRSFSEATDLAAWLQEQASDLTWFWNWFPYVDLNIGGPQGEWDAKIKSLGHLEATCTRKGVMDDLGDVNYCVYSRAFGDDHADGVQAVDPTASLRQIVLPALDPTKAVAQLREMVAEQKKRRPARRDTRFVIPMRLPSPGKPYYAVPTWYSIFKGGIYYYMLAMMQQRSIRMKNAVMFSRIIHVNTDYIEECCKMYEALTPAERMKVYNDEMDKITEFLKNPGNNGKSLTVMNKTIDGKSVKWIEIETVEPPKGDTNVKDDIAEIANVMLFAMGIHPQTVGAVPGKDKVASGTEARELNTLQQLYLFPAKMALMRPLYIAKAFNEWDDHLYFDIPLHVLTTLDKNKRGVEEQTNQ